MRPNPDLVDDLLALSPQPRREALVKILKEEEVHLSCLTNGPCTLIPKLLRWAEGRTEPRWCEHIEWNTVSHPEGKWKMVKGGWVRSDTIDDWDLCPVTGCHAPRPGEGRG